MSIGSGLFSSMLAHLSHLVKPGSGLDGELFDLRNDVAKSLSPLYAVAVEEWTTPVGLAAPGAATLLAPTATSIAVQTKLRAGLIAAGLAQLALWPRTVTFTTGGGAGSGDAPPSATITGFDANGAAQVEVVLVSQANGGSTTSLGVWSNLTSIVYAAGDGAGATVSIGIGAAAIIPATATSLVPVTIAGSSMVQDDLAKWPRGLVFTGGGTAAHAPATAVVTGKDINGRVVVETVVLTAGSGASAHWFAHIDSIAYVAGTVAADATVAVTPTAAVGLSRHIKTRLAITQLTNAIIGGVWLLPATMTGTVAAPVSTAEYTGTVDISSAASVAALNGLTVIVAVNGAPHTITFAAPATIFDVVTQARTQAPGLQVSLTDNNTHLRFQATRTLVITGGTANAAIGFPAGPTTAPSALPNGTYAPVTALDGATSLAIYYEYDASFDLDTKVA